MIIPAPSLPVDSNLNAKLADLEMGGSGTDGADQLGTDDILANWVAPEVTLSRNLCAVPEIRTSVIEDDILQLY